MRINQMIQLPVGTTNRMWLILLNAMFTDKAKPSYRFSVYGQDNKKKKGRSDG